MNRVALAKQVGMLKAYIQAGTVTDQRWGLCDNVLLADFPVKVVFESWEHYTLERGYAFPVEDTPCEYLSNSRKHDRRTKYGKLRLSLAKHCLQWTLTELREVV